MRQQFYCWPYASKAQLTICEIIAKTNTIDVKIAIAIDAGLNRMPGNYMRAGNIFRTRLPPKEYRRLMKASIAIHTFIFESWGIHFQPQRKIRLPISEPTNPR